MLIKLLVRTLIAGALASQLAGCADNDNNNADPVLSENLNLESGAISGQVSSRAASWEWLGIPYAEAPTGDLRWRAPRPKAASE